MADGSLQLREYPAEMVYPLLFMLFKIAMTSSIVWFVVNLVGLTLQLNGKRPNFLMGLSGFFSGTASWLHVGRCAVVVLKRDLPSSFWIKALYRNHAVAFV